MTLFSPSYVFLALKKQVQITTELETPKEAKELNHGLGGSVLTDRLDRVDRN